MEKYTLNFGKFRQYDKKFITEIDGSSVISVAFSGETLYIATTENTYEYSEGNLKKLSFKAEKLFSQNGKLYASQGKVLAEIKNGKSKKQAEFESSVVNVSTGLDGSFWLITEDTLYLKEDGEFKEIVDLPSEVVTLAALDNKAKYAETVYVGSTVEGLLSMKGKRRHWAELLPENTGVMSRKINCLKIDALGHLWVGTDDGLNIYDGRNYWFKGDDFYSIPSGSFNDMYFAKDGKNTN